MLKYSGKTEDGLLVVSGIFPLIDTHGIQLSTIVQYFKQLDLLVDWCDFYMNAILSNWKIRSILAKIKETILDLYDKDYYEQVSSRLTLLIKHLKDFDE